ncbi:hypothetical protein K0U27_02570 [archaeon]|nr:hypothetical protein [archaeon]
MHKLQAILNAQKQTHKSAMQNQMNHLSVSEDNMHNSTQEKSRRTQENDKQNQDGIKIA